MIDSLNSEMFIVTPPPKNVDAVEENVTGGRSLNLLDKTKVFSIQHDTIQEEEEETMKETINRNSNNSSRTRKNTDRIFTINSTPSGLAFNLMARENGGKPSEELLNYETLQNKNDDNAPSGGILNHDTILTRNDDNTTSNGKILENQTLESRSDQNKPSGGILNYEQPPTFDQNKITQTLIAQTLPGETSAKTNVTNRNAPVTRQASEACNKHDIRLPTTSRRRKLSLPLLTDKPGLLTISSRNKDLLSPVRPMRKFSAAAEVTRKISTTIGWRCPAMEEVVPQAKHICGQYIRSRLKRAGLLNKKLGLRRLRSLANLRGGNEVCEVFPRISCLGQELERTHPGVYGSVARQLAISLRSEKIVHQLLMAISSDLLSSDTSWAKIISLYAIASTLATDCIKQGHPEYIDTVIEGIGMAIEQHSVRWIVSQGGWSGVVTWSQPPKCDLTPLEMLAIISSVGVALAAILGGTLTYLLHFLT